MDRDKLLALIDSVQQYGQEAGMVYDLHNDEHAESFRSGWYSGLEQLRKQLTKQE